MASSSGCIELQFLLGALQPDQNGGGATDGNGSDGGNGSGGDENGVPQVRLSASNVAPQLDETVTLRCTLVSGDPDRIVFSFSPASRLTVDARNGTALFVVEQSDLGAAFSFTCSATNQHGTGVPSAAVLITPTDLQEPE